MRKRAAGVLATHYVGAGRVLDEDRVDLGPVARKTPTDSEHDRQGGSVATFRRRQVIACAHVRSGCQIEEVVDELNLAKQIISCHPSNLSLPDHVDCFVALNGSPGRLEFSEALFGIDSTLDSSMILFEDIIQVLYGAVSTAIAQRPFLLTIANCGAVNRG